MTFIFTKKMTRDRYILFKKFIHCSNFNKEDFMIIEKKR